MYDTNELYHHGILGQKWGKKNGPPYPLDGADHSAAEKKAGWRKSLDSSSDKSDSDKKKQSNAESYVYKEGYKQYKEMGYNDAEAKALAEKRARIAKNVVIAAGVATAAVIGGAIAYKVGTNYVDYVIKAGTTVQTLSKDPDRLQKGHLFYTNYLKLDKNIYAGSAFAKTKQFNANTMRDEIVLKNKIQVKALQDMKIASDKHAQKIFVEAYQSDEAKKVFDEVRQHYVDHPDQINDNLVGFMDFVESGKFVKWQNAKMRYVSRPLQGKGKYLTNYEMFNKSIMPLDNPQAVKITKVFTDSLEKKGYAGVLDINDVKVSNLRGIRPTIITDKSKVDIMNAISQPLTDQEHNSLKKLSRTGMIALNTLDEHPIQASLWTAALTAGYGSYAIALHDAKAEINAFKNKVEKKSQ